VERVNKSQIRAKSYGGSSPFNNNSAGDPPVSFRNWRSPGEKTKPQYGERKLTNGQQPRPEKAKVIIKSLYLISTQQPNLPRTRGVQPVKSRVKSNKQIQGKEVLKITLSKEGKTNHQIQ
jgi:hypothetical protein